MANAEQSMQITAAIPQFSKTSTVTNNPITYPNFPSSQKFQNSHFLNISIT